MAYKLTINVGGLCMLVQKESEPKGLYILMPKADHHGPPHCPVMITEAANTPGGKALLIPLKVDEDLTFLAPHAAKLPMPGFVLEMSRYAEQPVNAACFTGVPPACLAWKVVLPLGSVMTPTGNRAELCVPKGTGREVKSFTGTVSIEIDVAAHPDLPMKSRTLAPSAGGITISILNVPRSEWECVERGAAEGSHATHVDAYYDLLGGNCGDPHPTPKPRIRHAQEHPAKGTPGISTCPMGDEPAPPKCPERNLFWIEPANCTVGYGCERYPC